MLLDVHHLVGSAEIARMLGGISRQRVQQLIKREDWPAAVVELEMGKVWERSDIAEWARSHGRVVAGEDDSAAEP